MNDEQEKLEQELAEVRRLIRCKTLDKCPDPRWKLIRDETMEYKDDTFNRKLWIATCGGAVEYTEDLSKGKRVYRVERFELKPESWIKEKALPLPCSHIVSDTYDNLTEAMNRVNFHKESIKPFWWKVKKGGESKMEQLTMVTDETEFEPASSNPENPVIVKCPLCGKVIEVPQYDAITRTDALLEHLRKEHVDERARPVRLSENHSFHELMCHAIAEMYEPGGIVIDDEKARSTSCECVEYKPDKFWCTSKGVVGALTDEQENIYCNPRVIVKKPGVEERISKFRACIIQAREMMPPVDGHTRLEIFLNSMSECLKEEEIAA